VEAALGATEAAGRADGARLRPPRLWLACVGAGAHPGRAGEREGGGDAGSRGSDVPGDVLHAADEGLGGQGGGQAEGAAGARPRLQRPTAEPRGRCQAGGDAPAGSSMAAQDVFARDLGFFNAVKEAQAAAAIQRWARRWRTARKASASAALPLASCARIRVKQTEIRPDASESVAHARRARRRSWRTTTRWRS
jgi:hypothetical protein